MRIAIIGAGAIGGLLGIRLAMAGHDIQLVARGAQLKAIRERGLTLIDPAGRTSNCRMSVAETIELDRLDAIIPCVKANQLAAVAPQIAAALAKETVIMTAQNGIPWWYFAKHQGPHNGRSLHSVDPSGEIAHWLPTDRIIGSVIYPAAEIAQPGVIRHVEGNRFIIGELDGSQSERARTLSDALKGAGFKAPVSSDIRAELWTKLWGNLSFNPVSALSRATLAGICRHDGARNLIAHLMEEAQAVGESLGIRFRIPIEKRINGAAEVGEHKTSMLQDVEQGRALEVEALLGAMVELGCITGIATPRISAIYALTSLLSLGIEQSAACAAPAAGPKADATVSIAS
jgi:2-dehydropantoate 2-reductase